MGTDNSEWQADDVQIYGEVSIAEGSSLWPHVVIRAEVQSVEIGRFTNIWFFSFCDRLLGRSCLAWILFRRRVNCCAVLS